MKKTTEKAQDSRWELYKIKRRMALLIDQAYLKGGIDTLQGVDALKGEK